MNRSTQMKLFVAILAIIMGTTILFAIFTGNFTLEGKRMIESAWGLTALIDLMIGFTLFSCWIWYREASSTHALLWTIALFSVGFLVGCIYILIALHQADGNWTHFWLGART